MNQENKIEVCMAVFQRWARFPEIIKMLLEQTDQNFNLTVWNNSPTTLNRGDFPIDRIKIIDSVTNKGSKARFYTVEHTTGNPIVFIDDDETIKPEFIGYMRGLWEKYGPKVVISWFNRIFPGESYYQSTPYNPEGTAVDYCGTGGMLVDRELFHVEQSLVDIPDWCNLAEDLYLSAMARKHGYKLLGANKDYIDIEVDGLDQFREIKGYKENAFRRLRQEGWKLLKEM